MAYFTPYTTNDAPIGSVEVLQAIEQDIKFIPNVFATIAESSLALNAVVSLSSAFAESSFTAHEQQVILLATSTQNGCVYCVAGHTAFAQKQDMSKDIIDSLRNFASLSDERLNTLNDTVRSLIVSKGQISTATLLHFFDAGYSKRQFFELVIGICLKTFTNYVSNALSIPLDEAFQSCEWERPGKHIKKIA